MINLPGKFIAVIIAIIFQLQAKWLPRCLVFNPPKQGSITVEHIFCFKFATTAGIAIIS